MSAWQALQEELDRWGAAGRQAQLWWRDDDASAPTAALDRLLDLAERGGLPLALAVIPSLAGDALARRLAASSARVCVLQHGFAHRNHAGENEGEKKCELVGPERRPEVFAELERGGSLLAGLFGERALPVLVPPWNRIDPAIVDGLAELGVSGLSTYQPRPRAEARPGLIQVNCHLDIMRWYPLAERGFLGEEAALALLTEHLVAKREGSADPDEPTGILSHHAAHDEAAWDFLAALLEVLGRHPAAALLTAEEVFHAEARDTGRRIEAEGTA